MKNLYFFAIALLFHFSVSAQKAQVSGTINDTINKQKLQNSSVLLLHAKDSVLYRFTRSDDKGNFMFHAADTGKYILLVTQNAYVDYIDTVTVKDNSPVQLGTIAMTLTANILQEVIVQQKIAAIRMRGDTTEFTADSFKVRPGASVEEMLRILPGLQVDKDGKITAQGETVQKVLVDGEEFFGDDPTLATRNIQADAIDKVQVFDKKSDQATFTGIDDGEKTKTINLKLKADKKKGYFGKLDLASDFKDRWSNSAMINSFKKKYKISAYGIMSNTGTTGLSWDDQNKYGGGGGGEYDEDLGGYIIYNDDDFGGGTYYGEGLPKSWSGGLNYGNKWNDDKQNFNGSYRYNKLNTEGSGSTISQSLLPGDNFFINRENSNDYNSRERHTANGIYEWQLDSSTSTKITASGYTGTSFSRSNYASANTNAAGFDVNRSTRITSSDGDNRNLNVNAIFKKKFKKIGRTFSLNLNERFNKSASKGLLKADIQYFDPKNGNFIRDSITNQLKQNDNSANNFAAKAVYTEPITSKLFVSVNYGIRSTISESKRLSFDSTENGKYETLNALYSNDYQFNNFTHTTGAALAYNSKKLTASAGTDIGFTNFYQKDKFLDTTYSRDYTNFFPKANITYKFSTNMRLNIRYNGSTQQPTITQIQPVKDNTNPLFETVGNSGLKQAFRHSVNGNFSIWNAFKQRSIGLYGYASTVSHAIVTNQTLDTLTGKTTLQYINANGNYNFYSNLYIYSKVKKPDMNVNGGIGFSGSKYSNTVNEKENVTTNNTPSVNIGFNKYKEKKYSIWYRYRFNYNFSKSTVQSAYTTNYWTQNHNFGFNVTLPGKFEINSDVDYDLRQKTNVFTTNNNVFLWNAYIGRHLLKNDKAIIKITGNDLLNQNKGYDRNISSSTLTERNYQTIRRYFTLAFTWNFSKSAAGAPATSNQ